MFEQQQLSYQSTPTHSFTQSYQSKLSIIQQLASQDHTNSSKCNSIQTKINTYIDQYDNFTVVDKIFGKYSNNNKQNFDTNNLNLGIICNTISFKGSIENDRQHKNQAKIQIIQELKLYKIFTSWKNQCMFLNQNQNHQKTIQKQEKILQNNLKMKFIYFKQWKNVTIMQKRAVEYYEKKIYRLFFMTCSYLLQLRLRSIYVQEILRINRLPIILTRLKSYAKAQNHKKNVKIKKILFKRLITRIKQQKIIKNTLKLAQLMRQFKLKQKYFNAWSNI